MNITINDLKKNYTQGKNKIDVLNGISLEIGSGEIVALLGKSGSGKTTMLSLLAGLEKPDNGSILIGGMDITKLSEGDLCDWRAKNLGIIFQQFHLIPHLTALENILLPLEINGIEDKPLALEWLSLVGLSDRSNHYLSMLSGGEQQRVAIARALAFKPAILLADEPTGNLDSQNKQEIIKLLANLNLTQGTTIIMVTHD
ncbi:MAG: ABC transporter ATP-binding protein, partial [Alphaproteobacteria bacterium]